MNLFLIENESSVFKIFGLPGYVAGRDLILCFNYLVYLKLKNQPGPHKFKFIEEMLNREDYGMLHSMADKFSFDWYKNNGVDQTIFNGVSFGELVQIMFSRTYKLSIALKYGEVIRKAVKEYHAVKAMYCDFASLKDDLYGIFNMTKLVENVSKQLGKELVILKVDSLMPPARFTNKDKHTLQKKSFKKTIFRIVKSFIRCVINIFSDIISIGKSRKNIYFFNYMNMDSILNYSMGCLILPDINRSTMRPSVLFSGLKFLQFESISYRFNNDEKLFLMTVKRKFLLSHKEDVKSSCDFIVNGIDYSAFYNAAIEDIVSKIIPSLLKYMGQVRVGIKKYDIAKVILSDCLDERNKVVLKACQAENVTSIFVDHGIMSHVNAQKAAKSDTPDIFIASGSFDGYGFKSKILNLGNPSMDPYPKDKRKKINSIKKILFLSFEDNFYARLDRFAYYEKYYQEIFSIFDKLLLSGIEIYYRPHLKNRNFHYYLFNFFGVDMLKINYVDEGPFTELVYKMDLMVSNVSTCFFEAQAAGVPTIFMEPNFSEDAFLPPLNGVSGDEVLRVSTGGELLRLILANQHDPKYLNDFLSGFLNKYASKYMGELDGMAAKRIMNFVCSTK